jgi:acetolactate synthase I/III small subunit
MTAPAPAASAVPGRAASGSTAPAGAASGSTAPAGAMPRHHIVTAMVENKAGVLARVASLFSRRGFNIFSLAVAPTDDERFSRITIVVDVESAPLEQIMKQLDKLINVVRITELAPEEAVEREMLLVTVGTGPGAGAGAGSGSGSGVGAGRATGSGAARRAEVTALVESFDATIVDEGTLDDGTVQTTVMLAGTPARIDEFENLVRPFGITELQRTGLVALPKLGPGTASGPDQSHTGPHHGTASLHSVSGDHQGEAG